MVLELGWQAAVHNVQDYLSKHVEAGDSKYSLWRKAMIASTLFGGKLPHLSSLLIDLSLMLLLSFMRRRHRIINLWLVYLDGWLSWDVLICVWKFLWCRLTLRFRVRDIWSKFSTYFDTSTHTIILNRYLILLYWILTWVTLKWSAGLLVSLVTFQGKRMCPPLCHNLVILVFYATISWYWFCAPALCSQLLAPYFRSGCCGFETRSGCWRIRDGGLRRFGVD